MNHAAHDALPPRKGKYNAEFYSDEDGNADSGNIGSAGCIAIRTNLETYKVWNVRKAYQSVGFDRIHVEVS